MITFIVVFALVTLLFASVFSEKFRSEVRGGVAMLVAVAAALPGFLALLVLGLLLLACKLLIAAGKLAGKGANLLEKAIRNAGVRLDLFSERVFNKING